MPLYEYRCERCGDVFEAMQKFSDAPLTVHDNCGGRVERLLSAPALRFKGSGWYVTDYARKSNGKSAESRPEDSAGKAKPKTDAPASSSTTGSTASTEKK